MYAVTCPSEETVQHLPASARARGLINGEFQAIGGRTHIARVHEAGGLRLKFPNARPHCEAVIVNTAGGVCGGDRAELAFSAGAQASVVLTTQSAEKIYRAQSLTAADSAGLDVTLRAQAGASLLWAPQEAILFAGASLARRLNVEYATDARVTLLDSVVFGRLAMGEAPSGYFHDRWRVHRAGALVFAEDVRLAGAMGDILDRRACGAGARAMATLFHGAPDAEDRLEAVRASLADARCEWGASAWNGFLLARLVSPAPERLRAAIPALLAALGRADTPRVWN
jgi:urease accessory protein